MLSKKEIVKNILACSICGSSLNFDNHEEMICFANSQHKFKLKNEVFEFKTYSDDVTEKHPDHIFSNIKNYFKKFPTLYYILVHVVGATPVNKSPKKFVKSISKDKVIINIGSGPHILREDVINLDIYPYRGVSITASAEKLPIADGSVDVVVCDNLLEHVEGAERAIKEIVRVLKTGGQAYIGTPFMNGFHSSPNDFYRWTHEGLRVVLLPFFKEEELDIAYGPTAATLLILQDWLAMLLSFNIRFLYEGWQMVFMIIFIPLKPLDYILSKYQFAKSIALNLYFIGIKK